MHSILNLHRHHLTPLRNAAANVTTTVFRRDRQAAEAARIERETIQYAENIKEAIKKANLHKLDRLLARQPNGVDLKQTLDRPLPPKLGRPPGDRLLHMLATGHLNKDVATEATQRLLAAGANVNQRNDSGETAAMRAADKFQPDQIAVLAADAAFDSSIRHEWRGFGHLRAETVYNVAERRQNDNAIQALRRALGQNLDTSPLHLDGRPVETERYSPAMSRAGAPFDASGDTQGASAVSARGRLRDAMEIPPPVYQPGLGEAPPPSYDHFIKSRVPTRQATEHSTPTQGRRFSAP